MLFRSEFAFWIVNGTVYQYPVDHQFVVTEDLEIHAIFRPTDKYAVVFLDANGDRLKVEFVTSGNDATPPVSLPAKSGMEHASSNWSASYTNITQNTAVILQYQLLDDETTYTVTVTNGSSDEASYVLNDVATLTKGTAPEGKEFSHWSIGTRIVSYDEAFRVTIFDDAYYTAWFLDEALTPEPLVYISDPLTLSDGKVSFKGQFYLPEGYELIEYGLITSNDYEYELDFDDVDGVNVIKRMGQKYNPHTNEFLMTFGASSIKSVIGYLIVKYGETISIEYSDIALTNNDHLVIFEVYGGGGNSGATYTHDFITLYNPTSKPISVNGYSVQYASATGSTWQVTVLSGDVGPYGFYLIQQAKGSGGSVSLPTPEAIGTIAMSATAGKVALRTNTTALSGTNPMPDVTILDFVGFGTTANAYEGTGPTAAPSNTNSVARKSWNFDTNNNSSDFAAGAPTPKNSSSHKW